MPQEISVSYQAVKSKVYKLIDAAVEGEKTEQQIRESLARWWKMVHPADRAVAQKYLLRVLEQSHASLNAMTHAFFDSNESQSTTVGHERLTKSEQETNSRSAAAF
ncbi:MAG TPA: hypothetical protein VEI26_05500 [Terriglobales bacterium]|nr:hypothetical protein [Terriglobales bacterium]